MSSRTTAPKWLAALVTATAVLATTFAVACKDRHDPVEPLAEPPAAAISAAAPESGPVDFFFLPPLGSDPRGHSEYDPDGFDSSLSPEVQICVLGGDVCAQSQPDGFPLTFTTTTGPGSETVRLNDEIDEEEEEDEHYIVNWHTRDFDLDELTYRIRVLVAGTELGSADVDLVGKDEEIENIETGGNIVLRLGRTLPIKFRIEEGAVYVIGPAGGSVSALDGKVTIEFAKGATDKDIGVTVREIMDFPEPERVPSGVYDLGPDGEDFDVPVRVTIQYDDPDEIDEHTLRLHKAVGGLWHLIPGSTVNTDENTVTGYVSHFTPYGAAEATAASIVITPAGAALSGIGSQQPLTAETFAEDGNLIIGKILSWSSLNPHVVAIDAASGAITAVGAGQATVRAEVDGAVGYALVTVATPGIPQVNVWLQEESGTENDLAAVWGTSASDVFAVGKNGTILRRDASGWSSVTTPPGADLKDVWGTSSSDVYAVGASGTVLHYNGSDWTSQGDVGATGDITAVWGSSPVDVYVLEGARVLHYDGAGWALLTELEGELTDIWGTSPTNVYVIGRDPAEGFVYHSDGVSWTEQARWGWGSMNALWGSSPNDIFGVGHNGVVHSDGMSWTRTRELEGDLYDVSGSGPADAYAPSNWTGAPWADIDRFDGTTWEATYSGAWGRLYLYGAWATSGDVFTVGAAGRIVRGLRDATVTVIPSHHTFSSYPEEVDLAVEVQDAEGNSYPMIAEMDWDSSDWSVARVILGNVKALGWGTATITVTVPGGAIGYATIKVGTRIIVDGTGRDLGPLPAIAYALANEASGEIYNPDSEGDNYRFPMFGLFDTGSDQVVINNEVPYWFETYPTLEPDNGLVCHIPNRLTDANKWWPDTYHLALTGPENVRVRLNGLGRIDPQTFEAPFGFPGSPDGAEVEIIAEARPAPDAKDLNVTLIGAPVINQIVALIDYTQKVRIDGFEFYPDLDDPANTNIPGFTEIDFVEGPAITFFTPSDPAPPVDVHLDLERLTYRYELKNVSFKNGASTVSDQDPNATPPFRFLFDTGTTPTIIGDRVAGLLNLAPGAGTFDCLTGTDNGYTIDAIEMMGSDGSYTVTNASVCWSQADLGGPSAVIGSNLFDQVPLLFDGVQNKLGVGTPTTAAIIWETLPRNCTN